eukprot:s3045_g4.t1
MSKTILLLAAVITSIEAVKSTSRSGTLAASGNGGGSPIVKAVEMLEGLQTKINDATKQEQDSSREPMQLYGSVAAFGADPDQWPRLLRRMETKFTPVESGIGGALIGLSAFVAYQADGHLKQWMVSGWPRKITGISGILGPFLKSVVKCEAGAQLWKLYFLLGLILGGLINYGFNAPFAFPGPEPFTMARYVVAGFSLGLGTQFQRGCTSGHGICGLPRFSKRSWLAVPLFMLFAGLVVYLTRHVMTGGPNKAGIAPLQWPPSWEFALCTVAASLLLTALSFAPLPGTAHGVICPLAAGTIFGLGLGAKVLNFLDVAGYWDPSLAFVMGCGILVSFPAFYLADGRETWGWLLLNEAINGG